MTATIKKSQSWALLPLPTELADGLRLEGVFLRDLLKFAPNELVPPLQTALVTKDRAGDELGYPQDSS